MKDNKRHLRILLLLSLICILLSVISIYIITHNIILIDNIDLIYESYDGHFTYIYNGDIYDKGCNEMKNCAQVLADILKLNLDPDIYVKFSTHYNVSTMDEIDHYTRTSLLMSDVFIFLIAVCIIVSFIVLNRLN